MTRVCSRCKGEGYMAEQMCTRCVGTGDEPTPWTDADRTEHDRQMAASTFRD